MHDAQQKEGTLARRGLLRGMVWAGSAMVLTVSGGVPRAEADGLTFMQIIESHLGFNKQVGIDHFTFSPASLTVAPGTTVTWVNRDEIPHSIVCPALGLRSHAMDTGQTFSSRVTRAGRFQYFCGIHPDIMGEIMVLQYG
jgi:plastocyanin